MVQFYHQDGQIETTKTGRKEKRENGDTARDRNCGTHYLGRDHGGPDGRQDGGFPGGNKLC